MIAALRTLGKMPGRRIAVLGQMGELGTETARATGAWARRRRVKTWIL